MARAHSSRRNVARDLPLALVVHGGLAAVALTMRLGAPPNFDAPPFAAQSAFLWLTPSSIEVRPPEPDVAVEPAPEPARAAPRREPEPKPEPSAASQSSTPRAVTEQTESDSAASPPARPAIDWEQQRRAVLDQLRSEPSGRYATFSADDFIAAPALPPIDPPPSGEIFSPNTHTPSLLSPSQQHSRFVRKLADICHTLTGGFGVAFQGFHLFNACAAEGGRSDLFAAIKPEYLRVVPDCTTDLPEEVTGQPSQTRVRCRLVAPPGESDTTTPE